MPSKDTVKLVDENACAVQTPERAYVWTVQTPQVFECNLITNAYSLLMQSDEIKVTDDAMVVEQMLRIPVKMFEGSYRNVKLTTPEDLDVAESFLKKKL
jgi:2-C-methyl-D-erythritol 4-phosphate cytidylyltransferase